jgi:hypothetical protein
VPGFNNEKNICRGFGGERALDEDFFDLSSVSSSPAAPHDASQ